MELILGKVKSPYRLCLYGQGGVGKSTLASQAEDPVFFDMEGGLDQIDCARTPLISNSIQLNDFVRSCVNDNKGKTFVFDSIDSLEKIFIDEVCKERKVESLGQVGYGKGHEDVRAKWNKFLDLIDKLKSYGRNTILIGHDINLKYEDPRENEPYDVIQLKMDKKSAGLIKSRVDALVYMAYEMRLIPSGDNSKAKVRGDGKRFLHCNERPAFHAKNRYDIPEAILPTELFNYLTRD